MPRRSIALADPPAAAWTRAEEALLRRLDRPGRIQAFLDEIPYSSDPIYRSPRSVLADRRAHCLDGALLAAAALRRLGHRPLLVDMQAVRDDDHVIAVFRRRGRWGAIAKSNFVGLRFREPIYRDLHELVMSYFEQYYNNDGEKTLRAFSRPVDLARFDRHAWTFRDEAIEAVVRGLELAAHTSLLERTEIAALLPVDPRSLAAGMHGTDPAGLYGAKKA